MSPSSQSWTQIGSHSLKFQDCWSITFGHAVVFFPGATFELSEHCNNEMYSFSSKSCSLILFNECWTDCVGFLRDELSFRKSFRTWVQNWTRPLPRCQCGQNCTEMQIYDDDLILFSFVVLYALRFHRFCLSLLIHFKSLFFSLQLLVLFVCIIGGLCGGPISWDLLGQVVFCLAFFSSSVVSRRQCSLKTKLSWRWERRPGWPSITHSRREDREESSI